MSTNKHKSVEILKWQKLLVMEELGFTSMDNINRRITRFHRVQVTELLHYLRLSLTRAGSQDLLTIVKIVAADKPGGMLNVRLTSLSDLNLLTEVLQTRVPSDDVEYWVCNTLVEHSTYNFSGRVMYDLTHHVDHVIELVWWTSPRDLNTLGSFPIVPVARFTSGLAKMRYSLDKLFVPVKTRFSKGSAWQALNLVVDLLDAHRMGIESMNHCIRNRGLLSVSFEFQFQRGLGQFIDWDTADDASIVAAFRLTPASPSHRLGPNHG